MPDHIVRFLRRTLILDVVRVLLLILAVAATLFCFTLPVQKWMLEALPGISRTKWSKNSTVPIFADATGQLSLDQPASNWTVRWQIAYRATYTSYGQSGLLDPADAVLISELIEEIPSPQKPPQDVIDAALSGTVTITRFVTIDVRNGRVVEGERIVGRRHIFHLLLLLPSYYWLLVVIVGSLVLWAMRPRSPKCRKRLEKLRCPRCGYSMPNWVCSECGLGAAGEAQKG